MKEIKVDLDKIKSLRKSKSITIEEMSRKLGYQSPNGYYYLETGKNKFPADSLAIVAKIINVDIRELFFEK